MRIFVRPVAGGRTIPLTDDTTAVQTQPRWSPDGATILYLANGGVFTAPALGGAARPLIPAVPGTTVRTAAWSPDGKEVAFSRGDTLFAFSSSSGAPRVIGVSRDLHSCTWSPSGKQVACVSGNWDFVRLGGYFGNTAASAIVVVPASGGTPAAITDSTRTNQSPIWSPDGRTLFFVSDRQGPRDIFAMPMSGSSRPSGEAVRLTTGLNAMTIALSSDGKRLSYAVYTAKANIWGLPVPAAPPVSSTTAAPVTSGSQVIEGLRVSPDLKWLTFDSNLHGNADLYRMSITGGEAERLTTDSVGEFQPVLSPDGTEVAFHSIRAGVRQIQILPLNGGPTQVVAPSPMEQRVADWSPDGKAIAWYDRSQARMWVVRRGADGKWQAPVQRAESWQYPRWSSDGRSLVGNSPDGKVVTVGADTGTVRTVYAPRPGSDDPLAEWPAWTPDGKSIWFKSHDAEGKATIWSIAPTGGAPRPLVRFDDPSRPSYRVEWATDGKRIFFAVNDRQSDIWVVELSRK
jgi:Tol biopolymer transport system component